MIEELQEINRFGDKKALDKAVARERQWKKDLKAAALLPVDEKTRL